MSDIVYYIHFMQILFPDSSLERRGVDLGDKKNNLNQDKKIKPSVTNDQLGENAGENRILKDNSKGGKCR